MSFAQLGAQSNAAWRDTLNKYLRTPPDQSIVALEKALQQKELEDSIALRIDMMVALVNDYAQLRNTDSSFYYAQEANRMALEINDSMRISRSYLSIAWVTRGKGDIAGVLEYTLKAEEIAIAIDDKKLESYCANTLASVYYDMKNDSLQKVYLKKAYRLDKEQGLEPITTLTNLGYIYFKEGANDTARAMWAEALKNINTKSRGYQNKYLVFHHLVDLNEAEKKYEECINYCDSLILEIQALQWDDGIAHTQIKKIFFQDQIGQNVRPDYWLDQFNAIDESLYDIDARKTYLYDKYRFNSHFKRYNVALKYVEKFRLLNDSLASEDLRTQIAFYKERFDAEQRENEISKLQSEQEIISLRSEKQKAQIAYLITGLIVLIAFAGFLIFLYRRLNRTKADLEEANATKDKFFSIIGHDLRSPMIALQGVGQKLEYYIKKDKQDKLAKMGSQIDQSIDQLNYLLNNLLSWAMTQTGGVPYHPEKIDSKKLIEENVALQQGFADSKDIKITSELMDAGLYVDSNSTSAILRNVLSNAIKYTRTGGTVELKSMEKEGHLVLKIKDEGPGVSKEKIDQILSSKAKSTSGSAGEKGFGLGLQISREFILLNKGKLSIESEEGKGATFVLTLPTEKLHRTTRAYG